MTLLLLLACEVETPPFPPDPAALLMERMDENTSGTLELEELRSPTPELAQGRLAGKATGHLELEDLRQELASTPEVDWNPKKPTASPAWKKPGPRDGKLRKGFKAPRRSGRGGGPPAEGARPLKER